MDQNIAMRRAQSRHDNREEPDSAAQVLPGPVDEAIQYVRLAQRAGAPESAYELLCEATGRDLATRAQAAWFLGLPRLATATAIQLSGEEVGTDAAWGVCCLRFVPGHGEPWLEWALRSLRRAVGGAS